jgi:hypothetical protein
MAYPYSIPFSMNNPVTGVNSPQDGVLLHEPQVDLGPAFAMAVYTFFLTGTSTPTPVYQNGTLTTTFPAPTNTVTADAYGRFPAIYLDPAIVYRVVLTSSAIVGGSRTTDFYTPALATTGSSSVAAVGLTVDAEGEYTIVAPTAGGSGVTLTLAATGVAGEYCIALIGNTPGIPLLIVNNSATTGTQTAIFTATNKPGTATSSPAGWWPIQCDGVLYYIPLWFDNNFTRYVFFGGSASGSTINAASVEFDGNGSYTLTGSGATASPSYWFQPLTSGIGAGYYINVTITNNGGFPGLVFTQSSGTPGTWTNIGAGGLTIGSNGSATLIGTYQLSSSGSGSPIVGSGTITLSGGNGVQNGVTYSGSANLVLSNNGTATLNGNTAGNWYLPTTAAIGSSYWINFTVTSGTLTGVTPGTWTSLTAGLTIGVSSAANAVGTYQISNTASSAGALAGGNFNLSPIFGGQTDTYTTAGTHTETIPIGASQVVIECWGASAGGSGGGTTFTGEGGASGGYSRTTQTLTSANWGQTYTVVIGAAGTLGTGRTTATTGNPGGAGGTSSISAGTKTITTMTDNGGGISTYAGGSAGGTASGGTNANTTGNSVAPNIQTPGAGINGVNGTGTAGGNGSSTLEGNGFAGNPGKAIFKYT